MKIANTVIVSLRFEESDNLERLIKKRNYARKLRIYKESSFIISKIPSLFLFRSAVYDMNH